LKLAQIQKILEAEVLLDAGKMDEEIEAAISADLISDILLMRREQTLLLTGMTHIQLIKTAELCDLAAVVYVRGKRPGPEVVAFAAQKGIPLFSCRLTMYEASGLLFSAGLPGLTRSLENPREGSV
jgi:predicted transcriptional regulator